MQFEIRKTIFLTYFVINDNTKVKVQILIMQNIILDKLSTIDFLSWHKIKIHKPLWKHNGKNENDDDI